MSHRIAFLVALFLTGCSLTPTQQKWVGIGASVVITGVLIAHRTDEGKPLAMPERGIDPPSCTTTSCQ